jgi:hypothetical protein
MLVDDDVWVMLVLMMGDGVLLCWWIRCDGVIVLSVVLQGSYTWLMDKRVALGAFPGTSFHSLLTYLDIFDLYLTDIWPKRDIFDDICVWEI